MADEDIKALVGAQVLLFLFSSPRAVLVLVLVLMLFVDLLVLTVQLLSRCCLCALVVC